MGHLNFIKNFVIILVEKLRRNDLWNIGMTGLISAKWQKRRLVGSSGFPNIALGGIITIIFTSILRTRFIVAALCARQSVAAIR
jgi:hypothetical protein